MKEYLLSVILISVAMGLAEIIASDMKEMSGYIRAIGLLCILVVVISPLADTISDINENIFDGIKNDIINGVDGREEDYNEILNGYLKNFSENSYKSEIKRILEERFGVPTEQSLVELTLISSDEGVSVSKIQILLSGDSIFKNPYNIEEYFVSLLGCECQVLIKQK